VGEVGRCTHIKHVRTPVGRALAARLGLGWPRAYTELSHLWSSSPNSFRSRRDFLGSGLESWASLATSARMRSASESW
jgi:hypothetical protein